VANVILITGASRGIGAATARLAARRGYSVCVNYRRNRDAAEQVVKTVEHLGAKAIAVCADVAVEADVVRLFETSDRLLGSLSALVNNAGILETQMRAGFIYTEIHASGGEPDRVERVKTLVPMKRGGSADEVARAILWLLSDDAPYTAGAFIDVTGGK